MKTNIKFTWALAACASAVMACNSGCVYYEPPPPPDSVAVTGFVPDGYFWDGYEYVGWYGDGYYYWGPGNVWVVCDPARMNHVNVYVRNHPNWRAEAHPLARPQAAAPASVQPQAAHVEPQAAHVQPVHPAHPSLDRRGQDRDH